MADMDVNSILEMNAQCQMLARQLQESLPPGLMCALTIFTAGPGPVVFAHFCEPRKTISVLEDLVKKLKEKSESGSPIIMA